MKQSILFIIFTFVLPDCDALVPGTFIDKPIEKTKRILNPIDDPDIHRNVSELITSKGYPLEEHSVTTEDGYILSIQRIPHGKDENPQGDDKEVILFLHGEIGDSKAWFLNPPGQGLGYILPDAGYDVWMVNNRGSTYSRKNVNYPTRSYQFWDFSFDEMAQYDVPATIDYILDKTGKKSLYIISYSRGTTVGFALLAGFPDYNPKVKLFVALAPTVFLSHMKSKVRYFIPFRKPIRLAIDAVTQGQFLEINDPIRTIIAKVCEANPEFCKSVIFAIGGEDRNQLNETRIPLYSAQYPASTSTRILVHFAQIYLTGKFQKFDFGKILNKIKYCQVEPPEYNLSSITTPVALFSSENDAINVPEDVDILKEQLNSLVLNYSVPAEFNHLDFIFSTNSRSLVYELLLKLLSDYKNV